jgi:polar amino acid transport system substrate-binding protein
MSGIKRILFVCLLWCPLLTHPVQANASAIPTPSHKNDRPFLEFVSFIEPPYMFDPLQSKQQGLVSLILEELLSKAGIDYKITLMPPKRAELYAQFTPNTCVIPIEKSQEREVFFSWVSPILISQNGLFTLAAAAPILLESLEDARQYRIGSYLGSSIGDYLDSFSYKVDLATQNDANIIKLKAARIDLWASDVLSARYIAKTANIPISESKLNFFTSLRAIGCHEGVDNEVLSSMRTALQEMYKSGQMREILHTFHSKH